MTSPRSPLAILIVGALICVALVVFRRPIRIASFQPVAAAVRPTVPLVREPDAPPHTVEDRVTEFSETVRGRLEPEFRRAGVAYPPAAITLVGLKQEKTLEVYARSTARSPMRFIRSYPVLALSGGPGPKLREGDLQAPEGFYDVESLNPNSLFHLALRVSYPSEFDRARAAEQGRTQLGGDIMIHGAAVSAGCLAMGDLAAEDLFIMTALTGRNQVKILLCPADFRKGAVAPAAGAPGWLPDLYRRLAAELANYPTR